VSSYCSFCVFLDFSILYSMFLPCGCKLCWVPCLFNVYAQYVLVGSVHPSISFGTMKYCLPLFLVPSLMFLSCIPCSFFVDVHCVGTLVYHESIRVLVGSTSVRSSISGIPWNISRYSSVFQIPVPPDTGEIYHDSP
jgi:hypothetical protein